MSIAGTRIRILTAVVMCAALLAPGHAQALTRPEIVPRAKVWTDERVPYSQSRYATEAGVLVTDTVAAVAKTKGYRTDCSGFVSMALGLRTASGAPLSLDTASLPGRLVRTTKSALAPGDVILRPKTLKIDGKTVPYGHAVIFGGWADSAKTHYWGLHQSSSAKGAVRVKIPWGRSGFYSAQGFSPYRFPRLDERPRIEPSF